MADELVELAKREAEFHDATQTCYASIRRNEHTETWPIQSAGFSDWLSSRYYQETQRMLRGALVEVREVHDQALSPWASS